MTVEGIAMNNFALLELSQAMRSGCNFFLHLHMEIYNKFAFVQCAVIPPLLLIVYATQDINEIVSLISRTKDTSRSGISFWTL